MTTPTPPKPDASLKYAQYLAEQERKAQDLRLQADELKRQALEVEERKRKEHELAMKQHEIEQAKMVSMREFMTFGEKKNPANIINLWHKMVKTMDDFAEMQVIAEGGIDGRTGASLTGQLPHFHSVFERSLVRIQEEKDKKGLFSFLRPKAKDEAPTHYQLTKQEGDDLRVFMYKLAENYKNAFWALATHMLELEAERNKKVTGYSQFSACDALVMTYGKKRPRIEEQPIEIKSDSEEEELIEDYDEEADARAQAEALKALQASASSFTKPPAPKPKPMSVPASASAMNTTDTP